ncbi:hypothetical protein SERLA73DRAFT_181540 [Serpula lacrymans var. lacrymans S7.3]|uniref:Uncharacterized protein n=2 Tax=Serpula lacrymans var. lacrymans TaxID=341189 RepID=F8PY88_SERL3|nr:uncharacterized protein SERLADRAFT_491625 [Serpula lacrymans var. lacrymans S7.9]EGN98851.1 hypothetical protein SERLA73DRAFT_181540 [Serpula lacrymans var. lacrymans S7.3]EGO25075.1 hypothetical protein SERLADRAFT_491625 [Serpula lacrymans var. lacrymans S7.9]
MPATTLTTATTTVMSHKHDGIFPPEGKDLPSSPEIPSSPPSNSTTATLSSLYNRAAKAFLHRRVSVTCSLISSAFAFVKPPSQNSSDSLSLQRRKWDILRITLETTIYTSPPSTAEMETLPASLRETLLLSSQSFITNSHTRSLILFTPTSMQPNSAFLPFQVLITLVSASLKVDCPNLGRGMIEDWLSKRGQYEDSQPSDAEGYEKIIELYCLQVLPRLDEWSYATEFLQYENELPLDAKKRLQSTLANLHSQELKSKLPLATPTVSSSPSLRPLSPVSSTSSSSTSSLSTTSTRTAVPRKSRSDLRSLGAKDKWDSSRSSASVASDKTVTRRSSQQRREGNGSGSTHLNGNALRNPSIPRTPRAPVLGPPISAGQSPSIITLIKESIGPYFAKSRVTTFFLLFLLLPLVSLIFKLRRRRLTILEPQTTAELVKRRLANAGDTSILRRFWKEVASAVSDTVRMGGGGLV